MTSEFGDFFIISLFYSGSQYWEERVEEYSPIHHPDFDDLHREGIEGDTRISDIRRFEYREEDDIHLEKYHPEKQSKSVGK